MKRISIVYFILAFGLGALSASGDEVEVLYGFTRGSTTAEREWEGKLRAVPDTKVLRETMELLSARPHHVGSPYDRENAEWILARFKEWGLEAEIERFDVLFPTPKERLLELTEPEVFRAKLEEPEVPGDPTSGQHAEQLPTYNAYSIDGDVTAPLVYVNYGVPKDYEELERQGVSVKGAIVIARYGKSWRGVKPKVAAEHGAAGCIIYSDPREDGFFGEDVFPEGLARNRDGAQRGSVMDLSHYPGDPLTPGVGAKGEVRRLPLGEVPSLTKIPTLPISYGDAQPLLTALRGRVAPESFRGALPITYHLGPGPAVVHLKLKFNWDIKPVFNVIGRIRGAEAPDQWVIRGNHHDAWVNGAADPVSAQIALLEEARGFGELLKQGWKPKRTIIYCAWDGEEPMLLGSTEWVEEHGEELKRRAAIYINTDANGRGFLEMSGSHCLEKMANGVARDIDDPETGVSVWKRSQANRLLGTEDGEQRKELRSRADLRLGALGSGSDYTGFLDHLGVASLSLGFGGEDSDGGVYHSVYDDFYWYTHFADTNFVYARALAQTVGTAVLRFASADVLPYDFAGFADNARKYLDEIKKMLEHDRDEAHEQNQQLDDGLFGAVSDPRRPTVPPRKLIIPPFLNFAPLENALSFLERSAEHFSKAMKSIGGAKSLSAELVGSLNERLIRVERKLTNEEGLPGRPWYKHLIYAPGVYTGYGAKTFPGVREAIEEKRFSEAEREIERVSRALNDYASEVEGAAGELERSVR